MDSYDSGPNPFEDSEDDSDSIDTCDLELFTPAEEKRQRVAPTTPTNKYRALEKLSFLSNPLSPSIGNVAVSVTRHGSTIIMTLLKSENLSNILYKDCVIFIAKKRRRS